MNEYLNLKKTEENVIDEFFISFFVKFSLLLETSNFIYSFIFTPEYCNIQIDLGKGSTWPVQLVKD